MSMQDLNNKADCNMALVKELLKDNFSTKFKFINKSYKPKDSLTEVHQYEFRQIDGPYFIEVCFTYAIIVNANDTNRSPFILFDEDNFKQKFIRALKYRKVN